MFLVEKSTGLETELTDHYGNPSCGVIGPNEDWVVVGGCGLELHRIGGESEVLFRQGMSPLGEAQEYWFVHDMRLEGTDTVRILFDPWDKYASVWTVRCPEFKLCKIQDGPSLADEPYRDNVDF
ncbi:MAG: hypothetical protein GY930_22645 [bacterium]|nr:hypothetical protein [bacterium]